jgi:Ankyrin repeats (3 copies)
MLCREAQELSSPTLGQAAQRVYVAVAALATLTVAAAALVTLISATADSIASSCKQEHRSCCRKLATRLNSLPGALVMVLSSAFSRNGLLCIMLYSFSQAALRSAMARNKAAAAVAKATKPHSVYEDYGQLLHAMLHDPSVLQRHLGVGHDINIPDSKGDTLLILACARKIEALSKGSDTLVKQLLRAGADPNTMSREGFTPLMVTSSPNVANCLLDHAADIKRENDYGSTALAMACGANSLAAVKVLLKRGAVKQLCQVSKDGHTPLSAAANSNHDAAVAAAVSTGVRF